MKKVGMLVFAGLYLLISDNAPGQNVENKISVGARVGPNLWVNDFNDRRVGFGFEAFGRYGLEKFLSVGGVLGYESLKASQFPVNFALGQTDYLQLSSFHISAEAWLHLSSSKKFSPYIYAGLGFMSYTGTDGYGKAYPTDKSKSSVHVPFGAGFEVSVAHNSSVSFDLGYRVLNSKTDNKPSGGDGYPALRLGYIMYIGSNDDDDEDDDGLTNGREREIGSDPTLADTDGDGLKDGEEVHQYKTNPLKEDTDSDGINDGDEIWRFRTDPLKIDTDNDGLPDGEEIFKYNTDPIRVDTDKDGLSDGEEVLKYGTDPLKSDTDDDGLSDSSEIFGYKTDPKKADTDGGSVDDATEIKRGTNPSFAGDDVPRKRETVEPPIEVGKSLILEGIQFKAWSAEITSEAEVALEKVLEALTLNPDVEIEIQGHTDNGGSRDRNIKVSKERANAVKQWLEARGIASSRLTAKGFGPDKPIAPNITEDGKARNRRIEFVRTK